MRPRMMDNFNAVYLRSVYDNAVKILPLLSVRIGDGYCQINATAQILTGTG